MNKIIALENEEESILLLAAQRNIYSTAKNILRVKEVLVVIVPILLSIVYPIYLSGKPYFQLYSFSILFIDMVLLESIISKKKKKAALIQELFDEKILELSNCIVKHDLPTRSEIEVAANRIKKKKEFLNWYNDEVKVLPMEVAKLVCQKINVNWDRETRKKSITILLAFTIVVTLLLLIKAIHEKSLLEDYISILVMLVPFYRYYTKYILEQIKAARGLLCIEKSIDYEIEKYTQEKNVEKTNQSSRIIQDNILLGRIQYPLTSDIIYKLSKPNINMHNVINVKDLVKMIQEKIT